jgi:hypothetical protein
MSTKQRLFEIMGKIDPNFQNNTIPNKLLKRIPFLKEYNILENNPNRLKTQRLVFNHIIIKLDNNLIKFDQYNVSSEIIFTEYKINDNVFYNFNLKNQFHIMKPNDMDDLLFRVYQMATKQLSDKLSYSKEIMLKENIPFDESTLSNIINDINGKLFEIEEYTNKMHISLF